MKADRAIHPSRDDLKAFGLGKLDQTAADTVIDHLETCAECRGLLAESSGDSFLNRLRSARKSDGTALPKKSISGLGRTVAPPSSVSALPPELSSSSEYETIVELGRGGMGVVYKAHNSMMGRDEVLKVMGREMMDRPGAFERFLREIQSAAKLNHPNVVRAYSARLLDHLLVFSMEFVPGADLGHLVKSRGPLPVTNACFYIQQVANGLQHAHEKGMVHRDIKPANLILSVEGKKHTVKILDFGLAKATSENKHNGGLTGEGKMMGTPDFMAPEQALDAAHADIRADIYSLGCTLYYLLHGGPPFTANSLYQLLQAHQTVEAQWLNLIRSDVSVDLAAVVARMMAKDPAKRYQLPKEVAQALTPYLKKRSATQATSQQNLPLTSITTEAPKSTELPRRPATLISPSPMSVVPGVLPVASKWETMLPHSTIEPVSTPVLAHKSTIRAREKIQRFRQMWIWSAVAAGVLGVILLALFAGGAFKVKTKAGTIVLENLPMDADVLVDGETLTVARNGELATVRLNNGGPHKLKVVVGGREIFSDDLTVNIDGEPIRVRLESSAVATPQPAPEKMPKVDNRPKSEKIPKIDEFISLFNGKDLTGWQTLGPEDPGAWSVQDGVLVGCSSNWSSLRTERDDYGDFHLRVEAMADDRGAGSVRFRYPTTGEPGPFYVQIQTQGRWQTGSLLRKTQPALHCPWWTLAEVVSAAAPANSWFNLDVIAMGEQITIRINGKITANVRQIDEQRSGFIALYPEKGSGIQFRKIEIKDLTPVKSAAPKPPDGKLD